MEPAIDAANRWRLETPGHSGWDRTARPDDPGRLLMISADCHANEPSNLWADRIEAKFKSRLPRIEVDADGVKWVISDGLRRTRPAGQHLRGRGSRAQSRRRRHRASSRRPPARRRRRRNHFSQQGTVHVGHGRREVRAGAMPRLERLGVGDFRALQRSDVADGCDRDRRSRGIDQGDRSRRPARLSRPHAAVQTGVQFAERARPQLQHGGVRPACGR